MQRHTRQRAAVLEAIESSGQALTPAAILTRAQAQVARLNLSTIYRHLLALQDEARIVKVLLPGEPPRFEAACTHATGHEHHHHHFHCQTCERVFALHACPGSLQDLVPPGFVVQGHSLSLRGLCADCRGQARS